MKKLLLLSALLIFACSSDSEGNPCIYEPTLSTEAVTDITETSATLNGIIAIVSENCDVPNNAEQGFVYSTEIQPTLEDIQVNVNGTNISTTIEGLVPNTTYYVRSFLTNNLGDFYGNEMEFTTAETSLVNCDGNPVPTIVYGTQEWTVENACLTTYRDGTPIPEVTDDIEWQYLTTGAWRYYNNDPTKPRLYNWYAVMGVHDNDPNTPNKEFAPEGWHVPSDAEWTTLEEYLIANGYNYDATTTGNKIAKAMASTTGWNFFEDLIYYPGIIGNDQSLNNSSGFNAFPEGYCLLSGQFYDEGNNVFFWSSTESTEFNTVSINRILYINYNLLYRNDYYKTGGYSVRLVKD
jgi:uncharacterized protein (TIGR02145 family)